MNAEEIRSYLMLGGIALLGLLYNSFLKKYSEQKGKNLAEKEDVEKITSLVENVRVEFKERMQILKAELDVITNTKTSLISEESDAVISYYKSYFEWYSSNVSLSSSATSENNDHVYGVLSDIDQKYNNMLKDEAVFELFVSNIELRNSKTELRKNTLISISSDTTNFLFRIIEANINIAYNKSQLDCVKEYSSKEKLLNKVKEETNKKSAAYSEFMKSIARINTEIYPEQVGFQKLCKDHLYSLAELKN